jgi:hypothetical protein
MGCTSRSPSPLRGQCPQGLGRHANLRRAFCSANTRQKRQERQDRACILTGGMKGIEAAAISRDFANAQSA